MADDLLAAVVDVLTPGNAPDDRTEPPERRFVAHGTFAHDCELVAVRVDGIELRPVDGSSTGCVQIPRVTFGVTVLRCYPDDVEPPPSAVALTEASRVLNVDAWHLVTGLVARLAAETLFTAVNVDCDAVTISPGLTPVGPEAGIAGWRLTVGVDV